MRRADRLFQIVQSLRARRLTTASQLAAQLAVSERTIYRDVRDLQASGVPIEGEAGVGYVLRRDYDLPPVVLDIPEAEALALGARIVEAWTSPAMAAAARAALAKITAVVPESRAQAIERMHVYVPSDHIPPQLGERFEMVRQAMAGARILEFVYLTEDAARPATARRVWPLSLYFWGGRWTLAAWCERREDFRNFRLDRMVRLRLADATFPFVAGRSLADFQRRMVDWDD
jgi:predicted DNA-binding transcriptional regulator YafY